MSSRNSENTSAGITRRGFVRGGLALAALGSLGSAVPALSGCSESTDTQVDVLTVENNAVISLDAFTEVSNPRNSYEVQTQATLDAGAMLYSSDGIIAAVLMPGKTASPLSTSGLMRLEDGTLNTVLEQAQQHAEGYSIYAACASEEMMVWVECNYLTSDWAVYCAEVASSSLTLGSAVKLDEGDGQYDAPEISVIGETAYWIVQPAENGDRTEEESLLKAAAGGSAASVIFTSRGRFNGGLSASGQVLTAMPRADVSGVYYQLTAFQTGTGAIVASEILPRAFKPNTAVYINGGFSFSIPASYDYGGGISNVGTYFLMGDGTWLRIAKQPVMPAGVCQGWLFCKSGSRTVFVDISKRRYFTVDAPGSANSNGDYPVAVGSTDSVYTYSTVNKVQGSKEVSQVVVRKITPDRLS